MIYVKFKQVESVFHSDVTNICAHPIAIETIGSQTLYNAVNSL